MLRTRGTGCLARKFDRDRDDWARGYNGLHSAAQNGKAMTSVTDFSNSGVDRRATEGDIRPADRRLWLTPVAFRFTRPAFHRGRRRHFTFVQREHMPTRKIAMHKGVISHYTFNRPYDLAFRIRSFLVGRFAVGWALFQWGYSTANYRPIPIVAATIFCPMPDKMPDKIPLTCKDSEH